MPSYSVPAEFLRHQVNIFGVLGDAKPLLAKKDVATWPTLRLYRVRLTRLLREYQAFKHDELYDPAIASGSAEAVVASALKNACLKLAADYRAHVERHALIDMNAQWPGYRLAALSMMRRIEDGIVQEAAIARMLRAIAGSGPVGATRTLSPVG